MEFVNWCCHFARFYLELTGTKLSKQLDLLYGQVYICLLWIDVKNVIVSYRIIKKKNNKR